MADILYIQASPRFRRSHSMAVADAFVRAYEEAHPGCVVDRLDLFGHALPELDEAVLQGKYDILHGRDHSAETLALWRPVEEEIERLKAADKLVFSVPMWNFQIPYKLKHYLDVVCQPSYTFGFDPDKGYYGLLGNKPCFIAYARGGTYEGDAPGRAVNYQSPYLEFILGFMGIASPVYVSVEPTVGVSRDQAGHAREQALARALEMAADF